MLIDKSYFTSETIYIPESVDEERLNASIREAQDDDLRKGLGEKLFADVIIDPTDPRNVLLLDGDTYTDSSGNAIIFSGARIALAYWSAAKFVRKNQITITSHGVVKKQSQHSEQASAEEISILSNSLKAQGNSYFEQVKKYLCEKSSEFPEYNEGDSTISGPVNSYSI